MRLFLQWWKDHNIGIHNKLQICMGITLCSLGSENKIPVKLGFYIKKIIFVVSHKIIENMFEKPVNFQNTVILFFYINTQIVALCYNEHNLHIPTYIIFFFFF